MRDVRTEQGRTLREVAAEARVSMPYLSEVERGRKEPSSEVLAAVAEALGMRLVDVIRRAEQLLTSAARPAALRTLTALAAQERLLPPAPDGSMPGPGATAGGSVVMIAA